MKFILGKKLNMTQVFREDGTVVPVTRVQAGPCVVTQVKTEQKDGVQAVQVGFGEQKVFRLTKSLQGHLKDLPTVAIMRDFRTSQELSRGDVFDVSMFEAGEKVQVTGRSKGKGFQGVVKRHGFAGSPASHGHKDQLRMPGSIGATDAARVFKGTRMGGHMGDDQVTVKNLEIVEIKAEDNELLIKGAVPGARGSLLMISTENGDIAVKKDEEPVVEEKTEEAAPAAEEKTEEVKEEKVEEAAEATTEEVTEEAEAPATTEEAADKKEDA